MDTKSHKKNQLGKVSDIFFDIIFLFFGVLAMANLFIHYNNGLRFIITPLFILIGCICVGLGILFTTKRLDKVYYNLIINSKYSEDLITPTFKLFPISNSSILRTKFFRWYIYIFNPKTTFPTVTKARHKILKNIDSKLSALDKLFYIGFLISFIIAFGSFVIYIL